MILAQTHVVGGFALTLERQGSEYVVTYGQSRTSCDTAESALREYKDCLLHNLEAAGHMEV